MSKTSKRAILTFIIATFLIGMIPIMPAMAASGDIDFYIYGSGAADFTLEHAKSGIYSVELETGTITGEGLDAGRVEIEITPILLSALTDDPTFWLYQTTVTLDTTYGGEWDMASGPPQPQVPWGIPYVNIILDLDGNPATTGDIDRLEGVGSSAGGAKVEDAGVPHSAATWTEMEEAWGYYDGDSTISGLGITTGFFEVHTLADWKAAIFAVYPLAEVVGVQITYGFWKAVYGDLGSVYVDDITVNDVTYTLESDLLPPGNPGFTIDAVTPGDVVYGDELTIVGSGVTAGSPVDLYWDFVTAANKVGVTDGLPSGDFECTVKVPSAVYGDHYIWAKDLSTGLTTRSEAISVVPKITLSPSSGLEKDDIIVKGYGFSEDSDIEITFSTGLAIDGTDETDDLGYFEYTYEVLEIGDGTYYVYAGDPVAPIVSAPFTVGAAITLDKTVGPAGTIVKVDGRGFTTGTLTLGDITIDDTVVSTKDGEDVTIPLSGLFTAYVVIPSVSEDDYVITVNGGIGKVATAEFEVDGETSITVTPGYGTPGTVLTVKGYNFTRISGTDVLLEIEDQTAETTTDASGSFTATIVVPPLDFGVRYFVIATDDVGLCTAKDEVLVALIVLQLSEYSAPVGAEVMLMGSGFTKGSLYGKWNATIGDIDLIETTDIGETVTYFSHYWYVPSLPAGTYTINVRDIVEKIVVGIDFTVTDPAALSVSRASIPNRYNITIEGTNFVEKVDVKTEWWIYNSTDAWNIDDNVTYGGDDSYPTTDEDGEFTGYYGIPEFLELGSYTINCTTISNAAVDPDITQYAEVDIEIVPEELVINVGGPSYARGQTITFVIKTTLKKDPFNLGIKDPEGSEVFNSTWDKDDWKTLGAWFYIPSNLQIDYNTQWLYTLPADAMPGTWTYSFWDEDKEYANGTFQVTQLTELEQLQVDISGLVTNIEGIGTSVDDLATTVAGVSGAAAEAAAAAAAAATAAAEAQAAAEAGIAAISDVEDVASDALDAANDAKSAADAAKAAADSGLAAANDAKATSQAAKDAADDAAEAAEGAKSATSGLTTLVYGAIGASLIAALAAIVSLMQISRRIAG